MQMNINLVEIGGQRERALQVVFTSVDGTMTNCFLLVPADARTLADGLVNMAKVAESRIITPGQGAGVSLPRGGDN
jgi:hypothetical protein